MGYGERNVWSGLVLSVIVVSIYLALVLPQLAERPVADVAWQWPMVWCIVGGILATIAASILWGIVAGIRDPGEEHRSDVRDRDIERMGDRVGQAFGAIGGIAGIALAMVDAEPFWIGNAIFAGFFLSATLGSIARLVAYRRGLV
ncbi:hypothetical protein LJR045_002720 [Microbacterium sp. LjRoot45]|uniref:hypothetical protein n=1 Tax=Microbacterium sp. LjRoot45 TaxID=3342329 RepID=UPI003ECEA62E